MPSERLQKLQAEMARREKRRLVTIVVLGAFALALLFQLDVFRREGTDEAPVQETLGQTEPPVALPEVDHQLLSQVRDATPEERLELEPEPFAHLSRLALSLLPSHLDALGEPRFPFDADPATWSDLRGEPFRFRGRLARFDELVRVEGQSPEFWALVDTEDGHRAWYVTLLPPERPFAPGDWVVADGYYLKRHSRPAGDERVDAPLFVGRQLRPSVAPEEPAPRPDLVRLTSVEDAKAGEVNDVDEDAMWHLFGVARYAQAHPEEWGPRFEEAPWLDGELLDRLVENPAAFRGQAIRVGGMVSQAYTVPAGENPLREHWWSEAWLKNNFLGDMRIQVLTPGKFDFAAHRGAQRFDGWFLQLHGYEDREGNMRAAPVFVVTGATPIEPPPQPFVSQMVWVLVVMVVLLAGFLFYQVRRDRREAAAVAARLSERRQQRRASDEAGSSK